MASGIRFLRNARTKHNKVITMDRYEKILEISQRMFPERRFDKTCMQSLLSLLLEESGELAGAARSLFGRKYRPDVEADMDHVKEEVGDVLVIVYAICEILNVHPNECLDISIDKLNARYDRHMAATNSGGPD